MLQALSGAVLDIYRASSDLPISEFQDWAFGRLKADMQFDSAVWLDGVLLPGGADARFHSRFLYRQPMQMLADWAACEKEGSWFTNKVFASPGTSFVCTPAVEMVPTLAAHASRYGIEQILATALVDPITGIYELISLYRSDTSRPFSDDERRLQQSLVPHLSEAWRLCRMRHLAHLGQPACAINTHAAGVDLQGMLRLSSPGFTRLLREEWPEWRGPQLPAALYEAHRRGGCTYVGERAAFRLYPVDDHLLIKGRHRQPLDGLTRREREIAGHYAAGNNYKQIARLLGLAPATVRNHLNSAYSKLGVTDKAALASLMKEYE